ncbi:MAG: hypothetical protein NTAFB01_35530 [Nitrospira sp.]
MIPRYLQPSNPRNRSHSPICEPVREHVTAKPGHSHRTLGNYHATRHQDSTFTHQSKDPAKDPDPFSDFFKRVESKYEEDNKTTLDASGSMTERVQGVPVFQDAARDRCTP